jgi:RNA-directed DNA polymerase
MRVLATSHIRSYFTRISHQWLRKMVAHRIADPAILKLIGKWLKAGAMVDGALISTEEGTPQGGPISRSFSDRGRVGGFVVRSF